MSSLHTSSEVFSLYIQYVYSIFGIILQVDVSIFEFSYFCRTFPSPSLIPQFFRIYCFNIFNLILEPDSSIYKGLTSCSVQPTWRQIEIVHVILICQILIKLVFFVVFFLVKSYSLIKFNLENSKFIVMRSFCKD